MAENQPDMIGMMKHCMKGCRWCAVIPIAFGVATFMLGYFLDAEVVRILWLIVSGLIAFMGTMCFVMMMLITKT